MNHRITLLMPAAGVDTFGQAAEGFADVATVWADVRFMTGKEMLGAGAEVSTKPASIRIRARADVTAAWRVRYLGEEFELKAPPTPDRDPSFMFLVCSLAR